MAVPLTGEDRAGCLKDWKRAALRGKDQEQELE